MATSVDDLEHMGQMTSKQVHHQAGWESEALAEEICRSCHAASGRWKQTSGEYERDGEHDVSALDPAARGSVSDNPW